MNNFINNLISRHIAPAKNVTPRLRGKFEPENNLSGALPGDFGSSVENITEQASQSLQFSTTAHNNKGIGKTDTGVSFDSKPLVFENTHQALADKHLHTLDTYHAAIRNDEPVKPYIVAPDEFLQEPVQNKAEIDRNSVESGPDKQIFQKENHVVITNSHKAINKELIINGEHEQEKNIPAAVKANQVDPVLESKEFTIAPLKQGGFLGDPPAFNHAKPNQNFIINHVDDHTAPVIKVSIGQINVRAITPAPLTAKKPRMVSKPALSLEEYLKQRTKG